MKPATITNGVLENGLHYYIMHNEEPKNRASFYFAQNVGSILENDEQQGLAHFLEHMAFNGTQNFKDKGMLEYLEKNGIKFGSEINAFTNFDETVYNINQVPVENKKLIDSVLLVLHDWSGYLSLTDAEIDKERGVINEEWRTRNTANFRANSKIWLEGLLVDSKYGKRMPIGKMDVVNNFEYDALRNYYRKWYRPDQQAVIVVGDIDPEQMEQKVRKVFSSIPLKDNLPERPLFDMPINEELIYLTSQDEELGEPSIQYMLKSNTPHLTAEEGMKNDLLNRFLGYIFNNRMTELTRKESSPALGIGFGVQEFVRPLQVMSVGIQPKKDSLLSALEFSLTEFKRFSKYGATSEEIKRAQAAYTTNLESAKKNIEKRRNDSYAHQIYNAFFKKEPVPDYSWSLDFRKEFVNQIDNNLILEQLTKFQTEKGKVIGITGSDKYSYPKKEQVVSVQQKVAKKDPEPFEESAMDKQLVTGNLPGTTLVSEAKIDRIDAKKYIMDNGLTLVLYPTDFDTEKIFMQAFSMGGSSLLDEPVLPDAAMATQLVAQSGLGELDRIELNKFLAGKETSLSVNIGTYSEALGGRSSQDDLETLMQEIYMQFTAPRFDSSAVRIIKESMEKSLVARQNNVQSAFQDSLSLAKSGYSKRTTIFNEKFIENFDLEDAREVYKDRISNASDFTFVFVGDFEEDQFLDLAKKYLGSIPGTSKKEAPKNHNLRPNIGVTKVHMSREMQTPQSTIQVYMNGDVSYSRKNSLMMYMVSQLLNKKYMDRVREDEGGSYGVRVGGSLQKYPEPQFNLVVNFNCNPDKTQRLLEIVYENIKNLTDEIDSADFKEVKNNMEKSIVENQEDNAYWLKNIAENLKNDQEVTTQESFLKNLEEISIKDIKEFAEQINNAQPRIVEGILTPKT
ncbi:M16 family metallopeptidase [Autumnicola musiva]|uniref:Insulinase family protein n=1 Tax=Autumnicola musiva TaxID=3075589 RepID=A0ABU3D8V0_9FLAO|nr:insulinase family protein [Zunongwangia sp. F117]MDT0677953.1 insulinase family protein [Zunongwangia sp. F117]